MTCYKCRCSLPLIGAILPQMSYKLSLTAIICITLVLFIRFIPYFFRKNLRDQQGNVIPPGPLFRYAYLGKYAERQLHAWFKKYGPLYSVWMGDQLVVVISHPTVAQDLLVNNGATFSSRKKYFIKNQIVLKDRAITAMPYSAGWRQHRRIAMQMLTPRAISLHKEDIEYESLVLLKSLIQDSNGGQIPINSAQYAARYTLNNMLTFSLGRRTSSPEDPLIQIIQDLVTEFDEITGPFSNAVDFIPLLQHMPTSTRSRGLKLNENIRKVYGALIDEVKSRMDNERHVPDCLLKSLIQSGETEGLTWDDVCMLTVVFAFGGVHSISAILQWVVAFMATRPDVAKKAHKELDCVVGRSRMPTVEDEVDLPYIRAVIKEVQRIHAPFWIPTPHYTTADSVYAGLFIPKDTVIVLNCWSIHHNEERYPDSMTFDPERYLGDNLSSQQSARLPHGLDRDHWTFGAGRRICPGMAVAEYELILAVSRLLWAFHFDRFEDEPISLEEHESASGRTPLPFKLKLTPRHERVFQLLDFVEERA